ncbi:unnamed protein product [Spirodela intermedia]|uniref:Uncharacterized protein n=1 Tax=Spirodela intermedia TaxID=51605 RepID=A0A7I8J2F9_SPIIN|nr:unnamed protein product [Spirodela intermedia]CAA6664405.1 unnamed protein product [Spirodela intermedia]
MAGGGFAAASLAAGYGGATMTASTLLTCHIAALGGLIFGYDMGVSGQLLPPSHSSSFGELPLLS